MNKTRRAPPVEAPADTRTLAAVGRVARGIAHDFNNVLTAILGSADLIGMRLRADDPSQEEVREIQQASERAATMTRQLLAFSRRRPIEPQAIDAAAVARGVDAMLARVAEPLRLRLAAAEPAVVMLPPGDVEQVLLHLISHARETLGDGSIAVTVDSVDVGGRASRKYPGVPRGRYARIGVRAGARRAGRDPSLAIVFEIARQAGGTVTFGAAPAKRRTIDVLLPLKN